MTKPTPNRWKRFDIWDDRPLRQDSFSVEDVESGFCAVNGRHDPKPSLKITNGVVVEIDGVDAKDFDLIDIFIAKHALDLDVAEQAMAIDSLSFARDMVDINVPRDRLVRLAKGMTPAKLAQVFSHLNTLELTFAQAKLRARHAPANQAHVTNAKDDPLQLAADAATAALLGFSEIETTVRVARNSWSNALACIVGASCAPEGVLCQCSVEEAEEIRIAMAGMTTYAETISVYGTEQAFIDGDDTPWSKAFLLAGYTSRGVKARFTSGGGSELLMGFHSSKSILYLEARCLVMQRGIGVQGVQNGGIDGAPIVSSVPGGGRELIAENTMASLLDLECASGNDTRTSNSEMRVGAKIMPTLMAGTDFITSGMGSILAYDNSFAASLINGEEIEEFLTLQRDYQIEGGLRPIGEGETIDLRRRAVDAISAVLEELDLAFPTAEMKASVVFAAGSRDTDTFSAGEITNISENIKLRGLNLVDAIKALDRRGFSCEANALLQMLKLRVAGDHLQTSAIVRGGQVTSAIDEPNTYSGPGTGYRMSEARWKEVSDMRGSLTRHAVLQDICRPGDAESENAIYALTDKGSATKGVETNEVVIGISPGWGRQIHRTIAGHPLSAVLKSIIHGISSEGCSVRVVRLTHTADTSFLGLSAARLSGSGIGIGIQAKGTSVIHKRDRLPHHNLELFSMAPITKLFHYEALGRNAALFAKGHSPEPVSVDYGGEAIHARYHVPTAHIYRIETQLIDPDAKPMEVELEFFDESQ